MKKIFNWTFGGFFRTIGRTLAFLVLGPLFYYILSISNLDIKNLFLENVKADSFSYAYDTWLYKEKTFNTRLPSVESVGSDNYYGYTWSNIYGANQELGFYHYNYDIAQYDKVRYYYFFSNGSQINNSPSSEVSIYGRADTITSSNQAQFNACTTHSVSGSSQYGYLECPLVDGHNKLVGITIFVQMESSTTTNYKFGLNPNITFIKEDNNNNSDSILNNINSSINNQSAQQHNDSVNTQNAINNQTQTIQDTANQTQETIKQETNKTIETITDDSSPDLNGTLDNNTIAGWLPPGPIDSIVTLPLTLLNSLFNAMGGTCADLVVPLPFIDSNLNIPCMSKIYNSMSFNSFFNWIGIVASAFILYKYLLRLYKWIDATLTLRENTQVDWGGD